MPKNPLGKAAVALSGTLTAATAARLVYDKVKTEEAAGIEDESLERHNLRAGFHDMRDAFYRQPGWLKGAEFGGLVGAISILGYQPCEVIKARQNLAKNTTGQYSKMLPTLITVLRQEGPKAFAPGVWENIAKLGFRGLYRGALIVYSDERGYSPAQKIALLTAGDTVVMQIVESITGRKQTVTPDNPAETTIREHIKQGNIKAAGRRAFLGADMVAGKYGSNWVLVQAIESLEKAACGEAAPSLGQKLVWRTALLTGGDLICSLPFELIRGRVHVNNPPRLSTWMLAKQTFADKAVLENMRPIAVTRAVQCMVAALVTITTTLGKEFLNKQELRDSVVFENKDPELEAELDRQLGVTRSKPAMLAATIPKGWYQGVLYATQEKLSGRDDRSVTVRDCLRHFTEQLTEEFSISGPPLAPESDGWLAKVTEPEFVARTVGKTR